MKGKVTVSQFSDTNKKGKAGWYKIYNVSMASDEDSKPKTVIKHEFETLEEAKEYFVEGKQYSIIIEPLNHEITDFQVS